MHYLGNNRWNYNKNYGITNFVYFIHQIAILENITKRYNTQKIKAGVLIK